MTVVETVTETVGTTTSAPSPASPSSSPTSSPADPAHTPTALYQKLLTTPVPRVFKGLSYGGDDVFAGELDPELQKRFHTVGSAAVGLFAPLNVDGGANVYFVVYPTAQLAKARFDAKLAEGSAIALTDIRQPAMLENYSSEDKDDAGKAKTYGVSEAYVVSENVIVIGWTSRSDTTRSGDVSGSIALAKWGLGHLAKVRKSLNAK